MLAYAIIFALLGAFCNAVATLIGRRSSHDAPAHSVFSLQLTAYLVRRPLWLLAGVAQIGAFACEAIALSFGQLTLVEPLMTVDLFFLLVMISLFFGVTLHVREWIGALLVICGLVGFLVTANPGSGTVSSALLPWALASGLVVVLTGISIFIARGLANPYRVILLGFANGICFAITEAFTKLVTIDVQHGILFLFTHWGIYALAVAGVSAVLLVQHTYSAGPLAASQPTLMATGTIGAILLGVFIFNDSVRHSPLAIGFEVASISVLLGGIVCLASSDTLSNIRELRSRAQRGTVPS